MLPATGLQALTQGGIISPFTRARRLFENIAPGHAKPIELTVGDPREAMPAFVTAKLAEGTELGSYPKIRGSDELRNAIAAWIGRRYGLAGAIDATREILPISGSREGLYFAALPAVGRKSFDGQPVMLVTNPYYQAYVGGAYGTGCEPFYLNATAATGHLPDLDALEREPDILRRTAGFYLCSPSNPQGAVATPDYIRRALALARRYDFILFFDECYSEIYTGAPPTGGLEVAAATPERFKNLLVFNSLSKRSNLPGLRSGFIAGDGDLLETLAEIRNYDRAADAGRRAACVGRGVVGRGACGRHPPGLSRQVRRMRRGAGRPLRLPAPRRRLLPLARYEPPRQRRAGGVNHLAKGRCQGDTWRLPGPERSRGHQSWRSLRSRRARARCGNRQASAGAYR